MGAQQLGGLIGGEHAADHLRRHLGGGRLVELMRLAEFGVWSSPSIAARMRAEDDVSAHKKPSSLPRRR
jgi:hypothetical protein